MAIYRISKWESVFERAESRKLKQLTWVALPVGFTSHGYQSLLDEFDEDAPAVYGAWCALVGVAAGCVHRGIFCSGRGIPLTIPRISRMTGFEESLFVRLFDWASREDIRWLEVVEPEELEVIIGEPIAENPVKHEENAISGESPDDPPTPQGNPPTTRHNKTRQDRTEDTLSASSGRSEYPEAFERFWEVYPRQRRSKKREAFRRWSLVVRRVEAETLIARAADYAASELGRSEYAVMPGVWLNAGMWEDEPEAWERKSGGQVVAAGPGQRFDPNAEGVGF